MAAIKYLNIFYYYSFEMCCLVYTLISIITIYEVLATQGQEDKNYGPYKIEFLKYEICKGPKRGECGSVRIDSVRNMSNIPFVLNIASDCPVKNAKVVIGTIQKNNRTKKLWNYSLSKPCQHFVLGPLLIKAFNLPRNNCNIIKGHYEIHINMNDLTAKFLGSNFFYDTYFFKTIAYNNVNNFFCVYTAIKILKV